MPVNYPYYTYLNPGLNRRLSYGEYTRHRHNYSYRHSHRHLISRSPVPINNTITTQTTEIFGLAGNFINQDGPIQEFLFRTEQQQNVEVSLKNLLCKTKVKINKDKDQFCAICQDCIQIDSDIVRELECNHIYHIECVDNWLIIKNECPMCKKKI